MPTDTSTILGVFQAIMALLGEKTGRTLHVTDADVDQASAAVLTMHWRVVRVWNRISSDLGIKAKGHVTVVVKASDVMIAVD
jgi:hypothetical protein